MLFNKPESKRKDVPESDLFNGVITYDRGSEKIIIATGDIAIDQPITNAIIVAGGNVVATKAAFCSIYAGGSVTIRQTIGDRVDVTSRGPATFNGLEGPERSNSPHYVFGKFSTP